MKYLYAILAGLSLVLMIRTKAISSEHAYPYSKNGKWGICDKNRHPLSAPKYDNIAQRGEFIIGYSGNPYQKGIMEVYSTTGKWLASCCSYIYINDTILLTFPFTGFRPPSSETFRKEPFYSLAHPGRLDKNGLVQSGAFQSYLAGSENNTCILYASGYKVQTDFKVLEFTNKPGVLITYSASGKGVYDVISRKALAPPGYTIILEKAPYSMLLWFVSPQTIPLSLKQTIWITETHRWK